MKQFVRQNWVTAVSLLVTLPATYFIIINILKYGLGIDTPYDSIEPLLRRLGLQEPLGWNINLLILTGPLVGFALSIFQVLKIKWEFTRHHFLFQLLIKKRWFPLLVSALSVSLLTVLFIYLAADNYHTH